MLYNEFIEGTGCKDNDYNYKIYKRLELMYMADDSITKQEIYEYGKKLVDNSKSQEELEVEKKINIEIGHLKEELKQYSEEEKRYNEYYMADKTDKFWKTQRDWCRKCIKTTRSKIAELKMILA